MAWFFTDENVSGEYHIFTGENATHICKSLRMTKGEAITLCDKNSMQYECTIESITKTDVTVKINSSFQCENEPDVSLTLYQSLTKGDKMELIIQKAVELGVKEITPIITKRCISRPDDKGIEKKIARWQKIALQAAMQSRRGIIPKINPLMTLSQAVEDSKKLDRTVIFYEGGGKGIGEIIKPCDKNIGIFIGSEGGFDLDEVELVINNGGTNATLGKRILRAETAPLAAVSVIMYQTGNLG